MAEMADDEHTLMARVAAGDQAALHMLYVAYRPRLRSYLWHRLGGNGTAVEDALQEIWVAVWRAAPRYRPEAPVAAWIFQIAHHQVAHAMRDALRRPEGHLRSDLIGAAEDDCATVEHRPSHEEQVLDRLTLGDALRSLSPAHREVLDLVFRQGFSLAEVAEIVDVPLGTIKSRVSYARRALARAFVAASGDTASGEGAKR